MRNNYKALRGFQEATKTNSPQLPSAEPRLVKGLAAQAIHEGATDCDKNLSDCMQQRAQFVHTILVSVVVVDVMSTPASGGAVKTSTAIAELSDIASFN